MGEPTGYAPGLLMRYNGLAGLDASILRPFKVNGTALLV